MLQMSADELHNVYNINPANDKNTEIQGLSEYFKTNHSSVAPNKIIIMMLVLSCVIAAANCNPMPTKAQSTTTVGRQNNTNLGYSQTYNDWASNGNFNGQNLYNTTFTGQQNNLNIVCGKQTNNNTAKFKGANLDFFKKNLGNVNVPLINSNHLYESEKNSPIEADAKLLYDWYNGIIGPDAITDEDFNRLNDQSYVDILTKIINYKQIKFDEQGNIPIKIGNATFKNNIKIDNNLVKNSKDNLAKTIKTLQKITNGGIILNENQNLNTINIDFIDSNKSALYKGKNVTYYGHMNINDGTIGYNTNNNVSHANNFEMHEMLHYLGFHHNFNTQINTLQDCTITSEPWGPEYGCNSVMSYCHEDFNTINGATIAYILDTNNNIIQKIPKNEAKQLKSLYKQYEDALHRGLTFFDIMDIQNKYAKPPLNKKLINFVKKHKLTKYLLFKRVEDGVLQYEGTGDKINIMNCFKYYKDGYTYPIDPNDFTKNIDHLKHGSAADKEKYEKINKIKTAAKNAYKECVDDSYNKQEEKQKNNPFSHFDHTKCDYLNPKNNDILFIKKEKSGSVIVDKKFVGDFKSKELPVRKKEQAEYNNFTFRDGAKATAGAVVGTALFTAVILCAVCGAGKCCCNKKSTTNNRRGSFSGTATELKEIVIKI